VNTSIGGTKKYWQHSNPIMRLTPFEDGVEGCACAKLVGLTPYEAKVYDAGADKAREQTLAELSVHGPGTVLAKEETATGFQSEKG